MKPTVSALAHRVRALTVILALALGLAAPVVAGATAAETQTPKQDDVGFATLDSAQLAAMLESKDFFFVNVHVPYEGEIEDTDAIIPFDKIADNLDKLPSDKSAKIVLYCQSGRMSEIAAEKLSQLGFTQVSHLSGGMIAWRASGREIVER